MKSSFFTIIFLLIASGIRAENCNHPSDSEILNEILSSVVQDITGKNELFRGKKVHITYSAQCLPSSRTKKAVESVFTKAGSFITDSGAESELETVISISDARIILYKLKKTYSRTVFLTVHFRCLDASQKVILAEKHEEIFEDEICPDALKLTDDSWNFCNNVIRKKVEGYNKKTKLFSFILLTGLLVYFAFQ